MQLKDTNFGRIVVELNDFVEMVNPEIISKFEGMSGAELKKLMEDKSLKGEIAKRYKLLIDSMAVIADVD